MRGKTAYTVWDRKSNKAIFTVWKDWLDIRDTNILNNDIIIGFFKCVHAYNCRVNDLRKAFDNVVRDYNDDSITDFDFYCM